MFRFHRLLLITLVSLVTACVTVPPEEPEVLTEAERQARELYGAGEFREAADRYLTLAASAASPKAEAYRLAAVRALVAGRELRQARQLLESIQVEDKPVRLRVRAQVAWARLLMAEDRPLDALDRLKITYPEPLPADVEAKLRLARAEAYSQTGNPVEAARERVRLELLLAEVVLHEFDDIGLVIDDQDLFSQRLALLPDRATLRRI